MFLNIIDLHHSYSSGPNLRSKVIGAEEVIGGDCTVRWIPHGALTHHQEDVRVEKINEHSKRAVNTCWYKHCLISSAQERPSMSCKEILNWKGAQGVVGFQSSLHWRCTLWCDVAEKEMILTQVSQIQVFQTLKGVRVKKKSIVGLGW